MNVSKLPLYLGRIGDGLEAKAAAAAANAMALEFHRELVNVTLRKSSHAEGAPTPSAPGQPPALVTGTLRRSARPVPAVASGPRAVASVRVSVIYARIQSKGGVIRVVRKKVLANKRTGQFFGKSVRLPARPFMEPTLAAVRDSGRLQARAKQAVQAVIREAAGG